MQIIITGREQDLSLAEAEAVFGEVKILNDQAAIIDQAENIDISQLGGAIKVAEIITELTNADQEQILNSCLKFISDKPPQTKFNFGISFYGKSKFNTRKLGITLKRELQSINLKPRLVEGTDGQLNAASIKHNKLTITGYEFLLVESGKKLFVARTTSTQDIDSYSKRDYDKPCKDTKVGMLPPKLSQILINLTQPQTNTIVVDPFCGSGGLLIEAALMGYQAEGSDLSQSMIDCSKTNISWFNTEFSPSGKVSIGEAIDAAVRDYPNQDYVIASEGYLGHNFSERPSMDLVNAQLPELQDLYIRFFTHLKNQPLQPVGISICMPFWMVGETKIELNIIDDITNLGYTKSEFTSVRSPVLEYYRQGQYTGRQILIFRNN